MFKNYLKIALRNIKNNKVYSAINIIGLAVSIACALWILLWVNDEQSYDSYHKDVDRIYRVAYESKNPNAEHKYAITTTAMAPVLRNDYPQIEKVTRVMPISRKTVQVTPDERFTESNFYIVDDDFFSIFTLPFVYGSPEDPFPGNQSIIISERMASKYFGKADPVGKILQINSRPATVSAVIQNTPHNSSLQFDFLTPMRPVERNPLLNDWGNVFSNFTFIKLKQGIDAKQFEKSISHISKIYNGDLLAQDNTEETFFLQPLQDIYLHSNLEGETPTSGNSLYVYVFYFIAFIIVLIASINFVNLTTSRISIRGKEIAMRKIIGADRLQIIKQFLSEITLTVCIAAILALGISESLLSVFNRLSGKSFSHLFWLNGEFLFSAFGLLFLINAICVIYPVLLSSSFSPAEILRKSKFSGKNTFSARKLLVVLQFSLSITLIIGALTVFRQLNYIKNKDVGFDKEQILVMPMKAPTSADMTFYNRVKSEFTEYSSISDASVSRAIPGDGGLLSFDASLENNTKKQEFQFCMADPGFMKMYNIQLLAGREFENSLLDENSSVIINETACKDLGFASSSEAIGKLFDPGFGTGNPLTIIGVCKDVFFESLHVPVQPLYFSMSPEWFVKNNQRRFSQISLKVQMQDLSGTLAFIKDKYEELFPSNNFEYYFLDEKINQQYIQDQQFATVFNIFTVFTIFIACFGLLGLAIFNAERRIKEIGIRKVMGASIWHLLILMAGDSVKWVLLANIIAIPIAWFMMNKWLANFAYHINMSWWTFLLAGLSALLIAMATISFNVLKAASANPIESMKYE